MRKGKNMKDKKNIIICISIIAIVIVLIVFVSSNNSSTKIIKYSEYEYLKDKINDYNGAYSKSAGYSSSSILLMEDCTNIILMITLPRASDSGKDVALVDFTNMKIQNTSYNKYDTPIIKSEMNIDRNYIISSASTYLYSTDISKTYTSSDAEWQQIQTIAKGIGNSLTAIINGNDGIGINIYNKTMKELKNTEHI